MAVFLTLDSPALPTSSNHVVVISHKPCQDPTITLSLRHSMNLAIDLLHAHTLDIVDFFLIMALRVGQVVRGARGSYELLNALKDSTVFRTKVLPNRIKRRFAS